MNLNQSTYINILFIFFVIRYYNKLFLKNFTYSSGVMQYKGCDSSDDTISNGTITHDAAFAAGWKLVGSACGTGNTSVMCVLFHK